MNRTHLLQVAAVMACAPAAFAQAEFIEISGFGLARGISDDGTTVVLQGGGYWTATGGELALTGSNDTVAVSSDGTAFAGTVSNGTQNTAGRLVLPGTWMPLPGLVGSLGCGADLLSTYDMSGDSSIVVGLAWENCKGRAFRWDDVSQTTIKLPQSPTGGFDSARANCVSTFGSAIGGWDSALTGARRPARWDPNGSGGYTIQILNSVSGEAWGISADTVTVVGGAQGEAAIWRQGQPEQILPTLPTVTPGDQSFAFATDFDGTTVVGQAGTPAMSLTEGFYYREDVGIVNLAELSSELGAVIPDGVRVSSALDISSDGLKIVGGLANPSPPLNSGYILTLPEAWLRGDVSTISLSSGGAQAMTINAGPDQGNNFYLLLGSISGTAPGTPTPAGVLPLNFDSYLNLLLTAPNTFVAGSFGVLDSLGRGSATLSIASGASPGYNGAVLSHAYLTLDLGTGSLVVERVSNPISVTLTL